MTQALCLSLPDDTGDVLASIRRLIASDKVVTRRPGALGHAALVPERAGRDILLPCALTPDHARMAMAPPQGRRAGTGADASAAVSVRRDDAGGHASGTGPGRPAPLRLNPDAMIPPAEAACCPLGRLRLTQGQPVTDPLGSGDGAFAPVPAGPALPDLPDALPAPTPRTAGADGDATAAPADTDPSSGLSQDPTPSSNKDMTMHAYPTAVSPLHTEPTMTSLAERCHPGPLMAPAAGPVAMASPSAPAMAEENPLRALLREVVREEFEAEMQRRLDDSLRGMIRSEIVVALTEALIRRPTA